VTLSQSLLALYCADGFLTLVTDWSTSLRGDSLSPSSTSKAIAGDYARQITGVRGVTGGRVSAIGLVNNDYGKF
jgi:hypothetical protein